MKIFFLCLLIFCSHDREIGLIENAHDQAIWALEWHPLGHVLASGSNDNSTKFWARNKPGDTLEDFYGFRHRDVKDQIEAVPTIVKKEEPNEEGEESMETGAFLPGMGMTKEVVTKMQQDERKLPNFYLLFYFI